jgi:hypothetical protein
MTDHRRHVRLHPLDPANAAGSRSPLLAVSRAALCLLAGVGENTLNAAVHRKTVDPSDLWDLARWTLEHRAAARARARGVRARLAQEQARDEVAAMLAPLRELLG